MSQQQQQAAAAPQQREHAAPAAATPAAPAATQTGRAAGCPQHVLDAIYGKGAFADQASKQAALDGSLQRWWTEYADRKNDEEDEYVANSLLYDRNHLPRTAPAPDCVQRAAAAAAAAAAAGGAPQQQQQAQAQAQQQQPAPVS